MAVSVFSPRRSSYIQTMRRKFLRTLNPLECSAKILTLWRPGDLFVGCKKTGESIDLDLDLLGFGGRQWGGGNGFGEGFANFDPIEVEAFRHRSKSVGPGIAADNEDEDDKMSLISEDMNRDFFFWERRGCIYPAIWVHLKKRRAWVAWIIHIVLIVGFFATAIYFGETLEDPWAGLPPWTYMVWGGIILVAPVMSWLIVILSVRFFRYLVGLFQNPTYPERSENLLNLVYLTEKMSSELILTLTFFIYTIAFLLLFQNYPQDNAQWVSGYRYTSAVLGTITVWALGGVFVQYLTHTITKEVNVHSLGSKVRAVLRAEVALWRIIEVLPDESDLKLYSLMEDPYLTFDPRKASDLAKALVRTPMSGIYRTKFARKQSKVWVKVEVDRHANLLGLWAYSCMMKATVRGTYHSRKKASSSMQRWRSSSSSSLTGADNIIDDYYSTKEAALSRFKTLHRLSVERHQLPPDSTQRLSLAHYVYPELDLAVLGQFMRDGVSIAAADHPWSRYGVVRGIPKRYITKSDLEASLRTHDPGFTRLPEVDLDQAWDFLDPEHVGKVNLKRVKNAVKSLVQDRRNLKTTLENTAQVVLKLRMVIASGVNFFVFLCALAIFGLNVLEVWVGISSIVLAFSFVFGGTLKAVFDSVVFLFGVHPYDVGDKIKLGPTEDTFWIKRISLMSTQMARWDGASVRFMNSYLFTVAPLINVRRSGNHERTMSIYIDAACLPSKVEMEKIQLEMEQFLARSPGAYSGSCTLTARDIIQPLHVKVTLWWAFSYPDLDSGRTYRDTSRLIQFFLSALKKRNIRVSGVNSGQIDLEKGGSKKLVGLQGAPGTTRII